MIFNKSDRENVNRILASTEGNKIQIHHLCSEVADLVRICRRLEIVIDQLSNDFETLKSRMIALENKVIPKLAPPPIFKPTKKK